MKKMYLLLCLLLMLCLNLDRVNAAGNCDISSDPNDDKSLRYEISSVRIENGQLHIKGWALRHHVDNYSTVYKLNTAGYKTSEVIREDTNHKINIFVCDEAGNCDLSSEATILETGQHDFFYDFWENKDTTTDFVKNYNEGKQYYYQDIDFESTIDISELDVRLEYHLELQVCNCEMCSGKENIFIRKDRLSNLNNYIILDIKSGINQVQMIANRAVVRTISDDNIAYRENCYFNTGNDYYVVNGFNSYYTGYGNFNNGFSTSLNNLLPKGTVNAGWIAISGNTSCGNGNFISRYVWVKPSGATYFKFKRKEDNKCEVDSSNDDGTNLSCNNSKLISSECNKLTIKNKNGDSSNISIKQNAYVASILSPIEIYNGGGVKFGILYYNKLDFEYIDGANIENMEDLIKKKAYYGNITDDILSLTNMKIGNIIIENKNISRECTQKLNGNSLETICVYYFTPQIVNSNGSISDGGPDYGINNKYYLPLNSGSLYNLSATIKNASLLKEKEAASDSKDSKKAWYGSKWNSIKIGDNDNTCNINVYNLGLGEPKDNTDVNGENKIIYNFIYRPIDLSNPFPSRNPGLNWYDYQKYHLEEAYDKLDYTIFLDNLAISNIKKYNAENNNNYFNFNYNNFTSRFGNIICEGDDCQ